MNVKIVSLVFALHLLHPTSSLWWCELDTDCSELPGSVCTDGSCACPAGTQSVAAGFCADVAPYYHSPCYEDFQCSRLYPGYRCLIDEDQDVGVCTCSEGNHYNRGRCWQSRDYGETCDSSDECMNALRDPQAMQCVEGLCECAEGYYLRQRGECRKAGYSVGESCVLNSDCQFENGLCDQTSLQCYHSDELPTSAAITFNNTTPAPSLSSAHTTTCLSSSDCDGEMACSSALGVCVCPVGYYYSDGICYAELGSPATTETCVGLFASVVDGVCACPANYYNDDNMRDCVKVSHRMSDACTSSSQCMTFGVQSQCGEPQPPWGGRSCECSELYATYDESLQACRLFAGIGEACETDSDCLAGLLEARCELEDDSATGVCVCPPGLEPVGGLCLTAGLVLGDSCQAAAECSGSEHATCSAGTCVCDDGYQQTGDFCAPEIGSPCIQDADCFVSNTTCQVTGDSGTCQCQDGFIEDSGACWQLASSLNASCSLSTQCSPLNAQCTGGICQCGGNSHISDGLCFLSRGLFESCTRVTECHAGDVTQYLECRNGLCQCDFDHPYDELLGTCYSSASITTFNALLTVGALMFTRSLLY